MLSAKHAKLAIKILSLILIAVVSFFIITEKLPETGFIQDSIESVEASSNTVMKFSAATLSTSLAISALPDDFATPLADSLADMNIYFVAILVVLFLEKILIQYGVKLTFAIVIPIICMLGIVAVTTKSQALKSLATRLGIFGLTVALVVPCSTYLTNYVASDLNTYVSETIAEAEDGAGKLNEAMDEGAEEKTIFENLSELFHTAIDDMSDLMLHFQNTIRRCMNSIAILILTNCLMPLLNFFVLKWALKETFHLAIPLPPIGRWAKRSSDSVEELIVEGE